METCARFNKIQSKKLHGFRPIIRQTSFLNSNVSSFISTQIVMLSVVFGFELITWVWIKALVSFALVFTPKLLVFCWKFTPIRIIGVVPYPTLKFGRS